jgi:hypothetical protein
MAYQFKTYEELARMTPDAVRRLTLELDQRVANLQSRLEAKTAELGADASQAQALMDARAEVERLTAEVTTLRKLDAAAVHAENVALKEARSVEASAFAAKQKAEITRLKARIAELEAAPERR